MTKDFKKFSILEEHETTTSDSTKEIVEILRDGILLSPQLEGFTAHGAIAKLLQREKQKSKQQSIGFAEWILSHAKTVSTPVKPSLSTHDYWLFEEKVNYSEYTSEQLYEKYLESLK